METKKQIRIRSLKARDALTEEERDQKSRKICEHLLQSPFFEEAQDILLYASYGSEVQTQPIFDRAVSEGKQVFYPRVMDGETMQFFHVTDLSALQEGYRGIREPRADGAVYTQPGREAGRRALLIMPGAAFDREKNRIGYGKGFYDRFLGAGFTGMKIALAFDVQILQEYRIPAQETDVRPDLILSETGLH